MFEERQKKFGGASKTVAVDPKNKGTAAKIAENASRQAEEDITEALFATECNVEANTLQTEKDYINFAKRVSTVLYEGGAPYHLPSFMSELVRGIGKATTSAIDLKKIVDTVTVVYNAKVAEEKKAEGGGKKKQSKKPALAGGKGVADIATRNNNSAMVNDLMGDEKEEEYGEYGEETYEGKVAEASYDFM